MWFGDKEGSTRFLVGSMIGLVFAVLSLIWFAAAWIISPGPSEFYVLIRQTGEELPTGKILAEPGQKGIQKTMHTAGWAVYNPITWDVEKHRMTTIPAGKVGVLVAKEGEAMPTGQILAKVLDRDKEGNILRCQKGTLEEVLPPGTYRIHPYQFEVQIQDAGTVMAGSVGVVTARTGEPMPDGQLLAKAGQRGVQEKVFEPGTYHLNPYAYKVDVISVRSHMLELLKEHREEIEFPSNDGFPIEIDAAIEWAISPDRVAEVFIKIGNEEAILTNIIRPNARSISRMEGSKYGAKDFIQGANREKFEHSFLKELSEVCRSKGVDIKRALVRKIIVPEEIAKPTREAEVARQEKLRNEEQINTQQSSATLAEKKALVEQQTKKINAETEKIVRETEAKQRLAVAETELQTAKKEAEAVVARGKADADVLLAKKQAEAEGYKKVVEAFGGGQYYAMFNFAQMVAEHTSFVFAPVGEGTFWTDPQAFMKFAAQKVIKEDRQK